MTLSFDAFRKGVRCDLLGVPPMDCFDALAPNEHPRSLFPDGKSVVVIGRRIRRGEFRSMEEGTLWKTCGRWLTDLDEAVVEIERHGHECVPYTPQDAPQMPRRPVRPGLCPPNGVRISITHAAVAAGLGTIGYHGMFMTEAFGIRQSLGLLVTDMEIEPGPFVARDGICDLCMACAEACPLRAISTERSINMTCGALTMRLGEINGNACRCCPNGAAGDAKYFAGAEELHFEIENNQVKGDARSRFLAGGLPNRLSAACGRACIAHFEKARDTGYRIPFRIREPWGFRPDEERDG